jgi:DNA-binding response OmpR family regulator
MNDRQRIMVVDDNQEMLNLLNRTLELEGFEPIVVTDSNSVLTLLDEMEPDLVILDSMVPGIDSLLMLDLIRGRSNIPIIMLTEEYDMETLRKVLSLGADDYIRIPFSTRAFIARIRAKLRRTRPEVRISQ